jgi:hypothetical protein
MNALMERLPAGLRTRIPAIPPATPRNLWLLLAAAVATQNLGVFQSSQSEHITVFALLVWGGALICMEDQLEDLDPNPGRIGLVVGSGLPDVAAMPHLTLGFLIPPPNKKNSTNKKNTFKNGCQNMELLRIQVQLLITSLHENAFSADLKKH